MRTDALYFVNRKLRVGRVNVPTEVLVSYLTLEVFDEDCPSFGELRAYFDTSTWDVKEDGLIYRDSVFLQEMREMLFMKNLAPSLEYSEHGMQGDDFVSFDVTEEFIKSWMLHENNKHR